LASVVFLLLLGGSAVDGALAALTPAGVAVGLGIVFVIRPAAGLVSLIGAGLDHRVGRAISFFGIRGMGTVYYLAHAVTEERFPHALEVWAVAIFVIIASIVVHGITATPALARVDAADI
jgi:NhaP-type Na+/H+ or K+/H+ antiporter